MPGLWWKPARAGRKPRPDTCEAIDFLEYYALQMLKWAAPDPVAQLPGETDELRYVPLGVGVRHPAMELPAGDFWRA